MSNGVIAALLAGFALRLVLLNAFPLREDEALYAYWARSFWNDPRYLVVFPDKPPIFLWIQAVALSIFGAHGAGARVLSILASTATIALCAAGARKIWGSTWTQGVWAWLAASWLVALHPFVLSFAATGYTDSLLVLWGTAAVVLALRGQPFAAGILGGAAIMTKQQGVFFLPLVIALVFVAAVGVADTTKRVRLRHVGKALLGCAAIILPVMVWDASRWAVAPSPWDLGVQNYQAIGLVLASALAERAGAWMALLWYGAASFWAWAALILLGTFTATGYVRMYSRRRLTSVERWAPPLLVGWTVCIFVAHLLSTVAPWDRYLLPIFPILAMVLAGGIGWSAEWLLAPPANTNALARWIAVGVLVALLVVLAPPALRAGRGELPIGADHGDYSGLDEAARWVEARAADGEPVSLYHRALGWNLQFALYDAVQEGAVDLRWFPNAVYLADNASKNPARRLYVIEPDWATTKDIVARAQMRGLEVDKAAHFGRFSVLEVHPNAESCDWCVNRLPLWRTAPQGLTSPLSSPVE